ncbi:MAG: hypothetical protein ACRDI1_08390 [Actinomycetota bacterium]
MEDRAFARALERAYLKALKELPAGSSDESLLSMHEKLLDQAIFAADRTGGGLRLKRLDDKEELGNRLLEALRRRLPA